MPKAQRTDILQKNLAGDELILTAFREIEKRDPDGELVGLTARLLSITEERVMDALERDAERKDATAAKSSSLLAGIRPELIEDLAKQFERMDQPLSLGWMQRRSVSLDELRALGHAVGALLRSTVGQPPGRTVANPADTILGKRQHDAANSPTETATDE